MGSSPCKKPNTPDDFDFASPRPVIGAVVFATRGGWWQIVGVVLRFLAHGWRGFEVGTGTNHFLGEDLV
jgi:hypothetical protein